MAQAAAAAAAPVRHSSWLWFSSHPTAVAIAGHLSSFFTTKPQIPSSPPTNPRRRFSSAASLTNGTRTRTRSRTRGLRPSVSPPVADDPREDDDADLDSTQARKSRNELKREARRAVRWAMELATFSTPQVKRILRVASLDGEVFDALMLVKRLGPDVREGKRRQFNYIGRLLRTAQPELMDALIQASKDGDNDRLLALSGRETLSVEDDDEEEETDYDEGCESFIEIATRWYDGLVYQDPSITNEVYSIHNVEFDRQELRKHVRGVQSVLEESSVVENGVGNGVMLTRAKKPLIRFLRSLAKESLAQ